MAAAVRALLFWYRTGAPENKFNHTGAVRAAGWTWTQYLMSTHIPLIKTSSMAPLKVRELQNAVAFTANHSKGGSEERIVTKTDSLDFRRSSGNRRSFEQLRSVVAFRKASWCQWPLSPSLMLLTLLGQELGWGGWGKDMGLVAWSRGWQTLPGRVRE